MKSINGETRITGIIGYPVRYSLSPIFQNYLFAKHGLNFVYLPFPVEDERFVEIAVRGLLYSGVAGLNVTIPYKEKAVAVADRVDPLVEFVGAANTLKFEKGKIYAYNTDGPGFWDGVEKVKKIDYSSTTLVILGSGGAAKGIIGEAKFRGVKNYILFARTTSKAREIADKLVNVEVTIFPWNHMKDFLFSPGSIIVNTTPLGMQGETIPLSWKFKDPASTIIADVVYMPLKTPLIRKAEELEIISIPGYIMLAGQGVKSFEIWTGQKADFDDTLQFLRRILDENSSSS